MNGLEVMLSDLKDGTFKFKRNDFETENEKEHMRQILIKQIEKQLEPEKSKPKKNEKDKGSNGYKDYEYKGKKLGGSASYERVTEGKFVDKKTGQILDGRIERKLHTFCKGDDKVYLTVAGHHVEVCSINGREIEPPNIKKISKTEYQDLKTGEIMTFRTSENRSENVDSFRKTMKKLRGIIKTNFLGESNELFVTLTYSGENQTNDYKKIYDDVGEFVRRLRRHCTSKRKKRKYNSLPVSDRIEYINVIEPHESGNWHSHILIKFLDLDNVYIPNKVQWENGVPTVIDSPLRELWGMGNITIKSLKGNDDIGAYLSAYMTDLQVPDDYSKCNENLVLKEIEGKKKKFIKGGRIAYYPNGMNLYSKSSGIKLPTKKIMSYFEIEKVVGSAKPHYQSEVLLDNKNKITTIKHEQYNLKRQGKKYKGLKKVKKELKKDGD